MKSRSLPAQPSARGDLRTVGTLLPYLWPKGEPQLRRRVAAAVFFLVAAKGMNVAVPALYKFVVDGLAADKFGRITAMPIMLVVAYGVTRMLSQAFGELRDAVFAKVAQRAIRSAGLRTFEHLHALNLRFHLDRRTGAVSRRSSAAPRASISSSASCCSTFCRRCWRSCSSAASCGPCSGASSSPLSASPATSPSPSR